MSRTGRYSQKNTEENPSAKDPFFTNDASNVSTPITEQIWRPEVRQHSCFAVNIQIAPNELVRFPAIYLLLSFDSLMPCICAPILHS